MISSALRAAFEITVCKAEIRMIFSLQRQFLLFLLLPVAIIVIATGVVAFAIARTFIYDQWVAATSLKLEKAALGIGSRLDEKLKFISLIAKAGDGPDSAVTQTFLIQQLIDMSGVKFVDLDVEAHKEGDQHKPEDYADRFGTGFVEGRYVLELCEDVGVCAPLTDPSSVDRSLRLVKMLRGNKDEPARRLIVTVSFDSLLEPIKQMGPWEGTSAALVTSTGQFLAATDKSQSKRMKLGETGDPLEKRALAEIRKLNFGTVWGSGHPPETIIGFHKIPEINWYVVLYSKGSEVLEPMVRFRFLFTIAIIGAIAVILVLIRVVTRFVGKSIAEISTAASRVREGDYSVTLPETRNDEIGQLARSFNEMTQGLKQRDLIEQTFGRYVDKTVAQELMSRPEALRLGGEKKTVTIMMTDLRNFTGIAETLPPEKVIRLLNHYFGRMIAVVERYNGIIVDFYGDSILVFFDGLATDVTQRAADAVKCAIEMQYEQQLFSKDMQQRGLPELHMGIGIHTGEVVVGNIGTESRAKYGIVGSDVNLTERIQSAAGADRVVISEQTYKILGDRVTIKGDFRVCLKGVSGDRELYEVDCVDWEGLWCSINK